LGGLDDAEAFEATRRNTVGNMREIFSMLRAGLPATAHETPVHALEHARFLRSRGTGYSAMVASYEYGLAMFRAVGGLELEARMPDAAQRERLALAWDQFVFSFVGQMLERLLHEWDLREGAWHPVAGDAVLANPASAELRAQVPADRADPASPRCGSARARGPARPRAGRGRRRRRGRFLMLEKMLGGESAEETEESGFDFETEELLEPAAGYEFHQGALDFAEEWPGAYWSIHVDDVYKRFGSYQVLNGLQLGIPEGMITVVLGPSGTGKSVLLNHLVGLMFPDQGDVIVHGDSVRHMTMSELLAMRRKFGILFQDGALFGSMNVYDNVAFPLRQHTDKSEAEIREIVSRRLSEVGLERAEERMPNELSGGMRKRAGFARALVLEPEIVLFDEPDSGLDPVRTALLCELILKMHAEYGGTYIVITHDIASARKLGQYIAVLWKGRIVQAGDGTDMFASPNPFVRQFLAGNARGPLGME
jgi:phospholipid/cholesterol/gamma-HCH transport system ATP-binding protein